MISWAQHLFPIPRSITGDGVRDTLDYLKNINPEIEVHTFETGENVFDWNIPQEWKIRDAYIEHVGSGLRFAEFKKSNLHIMGYSEPIETLLDKSELLPHIYTQAEQPDLIPYVTSYYHRRWGFCMSQNQKDALPDGQYHVLIDSDLFHGKLILGDAIIEGKYKDEIVFSSYICHPSMANNELSGPVVISALMRFIKDNFPSPKFTYRFILAPETIGTIAYLSRNFEAMKSKVICGFNLSCVGDERAFSHVESRLGNSLADKALRAGLIGKENIHTYSFLERGSDERQYCAPGIDLPFVGFCRSKYGEYPEYHTDADNFDVVTANGLNGSFEVMANIINAFETGLYPSNQVYCEPQLSKRGLYPSISQKGSYSSYKTRMDFLAYADGAHSLFEISEIIDTPLQLVIDEAKLLNCHGLVKLFDDPSQS